MTQPDLLALTPLVVLTVAVAGIMLQVAFFRHHFLTAILAVVACLVAMLSIAWTSDGTARRITTLLVIDGYARFYIGLILLASLTILCMSLPYLAMRPTGESRPDEYYLLLLLATIGACVLVASDHIVSFFLGLELLSVSLYALIGYLRARPRSLEGAVKYLVLSASASAFLLFGLALVYAESGTMEFSKMGVLGRLEAGMSITLLTGVGFVLIAVGFKLGIAPFHMWTPDVYQGAPAPAAAFVATCSKAAVFALLLRLTGAMGLQGSETFWSLIAVMAALSMSVGNVLALRQTDVKRLLAYSSVAHLGYALVAYLAGGALAVEAVTMYLVAYVLTSLGAFAVVTRLSTPDQDGDALDRYQGLLWRRPWLAVAMAVMLLSLAGIPFTVGFIGKFYAVAAGVGGGLWGLLLILVANSVVGLFYYLRVLMAMAADLPPSPKSVCLPEPQYGWVGGWSLALVTVLTLWIGLQPEPLIRVIRSIVVGGM